MQKSQQDSRTNSSDKAGLQALQSVACGRTCVV
jgi:hypothetical protein